MVGPFFEIGPDASAFNRAKGHVAFHYDAVNLDYGICANFGDYLHTNFFVGVAGVGIKQHLTSEYANEDGTIARKIKSPSSFIGAGPELGVDFVYDICGGFQFIGGGSAGLLVGELKNHTKYETISPDLPPLGITPPNTQTTSVNHRTHVVPAFEADLGLAYSFDMCNFSFNLSAGYEVRMYVNAIQSVDMGSEVDTPPIVPAITGVYARTFQRTQSNFALSGPYIRLNIGF